MPIDLDAYCGRIGYEGPREPTLDVLSALHALHPAAIPFENLDPLLGRPVSLDIDALQSKLLGQRRGGYCFEQNALFRAALEAMRFQISPLIARVVWMTPPDRPLGGRNHMLLRVDLPGGPYIADVGFGGQLASAPLKLVPGLEQPTAEAVFRLVAAGDAFVLETQLPVGWTSLYRFTLEPAEDSDYELSNWYTSTHPTFLLTTNLLAERLTPEVRLSLFNTRLTRRTPDGRAEVVELSTPEALARTLESDFNLPPPVDPTALFARLPAAESAG
jgi:N-hydroxyarylamine O-acetyltransferase